MAASMIQQAAAYATVTADRTAYRRQGKAWQPAALAVSVLVFAWPEFSLVIRGVPASYPVVTAIFTLVIVAIVTTWPRDSSERSAPMSTQRAVPFVAVAVAAVVIIGAYRWVRLAVWNPYHADMLIVIREATRRFLGGHTPYTT